MDPLTIGLITGGASLLGSIFTSNQSGENTQDQIAASQSQQATQNAFSERMSNTAYQRASSDMKAAGLNPMMMFGSGAAASSPTGSSIQAPMPQTKSPLGDLGSNVGQAVATAVQAKTMDKMSDEMANLKVQNDLIKKQTDLTNMNTGAVAQKMNIQLPDETKAKLFNEWLRTHPSLTSGAEVVRYGGEALKPALGAAGEIGAAGVLGKLMAGPSKAETAFRGSSANAVRRGMDLERSFSDRFDAAYGNSR